MSAPSETSPGKNPFLQALERAIGVAPTSAPRQSARLAAAINAAGENDWSTDSDGSVVISGQVCIHPEHAKADHQPLSLGVLNCRTIAAAPAFRRACMRFNDLADAIREGRIKGDDITNAVLVIDHEVNRPALAKAGVA